MNEDLKIIKKNYGENMAHLCRELFPSLLEKEGLLSSILLSKFAPTRSLYEDIKEQYYEESFKNYIYSFVDVEKKETEVQKTVSELLDEAGYEFHECHSEKDIQSFKKYYAPKEELCTFNGNRLNRCFVFFAVKKDVEKIKREDFREPNRQDRYGTSVISIQFSRGTNNTLSIKNRYNHRVNNPDATFSNNLENIIPGLTVAFEREYGLKINQNEYQGFELDNYVMGNDKKFYRYNYEINNIYYCENNTIVANGEVIPLNKSQYLLIDYFIIDLKEKKVTTLDQELNDSFIDCFDKIDKIEIINEQEDKIVRIKSLEKEDVVIKINKYGQIIELKDSNIKYIKNDFLEYNKTLKVIELSNLEEVGNYFLTRLITVEKLYLPKLKKIGKSFLVRIEEIDELSLPSLEKTGQWFMDNCDSIEKLDLPNLVQIDDYFLGQCVRIEEYNMPKVKKIGIYFLNQIEHFEELNLPNLEEVGDYFMIDSKNIDRINLPKLKKVGLLFLPSIEELEELSLPNLEETGNDFMEECITIDKIYLPKLMKTGDNFLINCTNPQKFEVGGQNEETRNNKSR